MPQALHERLQAEADRNKRGIGVEIVDRLEKSFIAPRADDPATAELLDAIGRAAEILSTTWTPWGVDKMAHQIFKETVMRLLDQHTPGRSGTPMSEDAKLIFGGDDAGARLAWVVSLKGR
jgi:hypothetical protein